MASRRLLAELAANPLAAGRVDRRPVEMRTALIQRFGGGGGVKLGIGQPIAVGGGNGRGQDDLDRWQLRAGRRATTPG